MRNLRTSITGPAHSGEQCLPQSRRTPRFPRHEETTVVPQKMSQMLGHTAVPTPDAWFAPVLCSCSSGAGGNIGG